jgi:hypothetical protein
MYKAAAPLTNAVAMEVPDFVAVAVSLVWLADKIVSPGAKISRQGPILEKLALLSAMVVAPTVIAASAELGE